MELENYKQILKKRAEILSKPIDTEESTINSLEVLLFDLGEEKYGIETKYIFGVHPLKNYTALPCAPPFVYGLVNVRRKIVLVVDLKVVFSIPNSNDKDILKKLIILGTDESNFALITDGLSEIKKISKDGLQSSLPTFTGIREEFLKGLTKDGIVILDGQKMLTSQYLVVNENLPQ